MRPGIALGACANHNALAALWPAEIFPFKTSSTTYLLDQFSLDCSPINSHKFFI